MVVGAPQLNKMRALRDGDKTIKQLPADKTAEGHTVYRIELTAKGENKVKAVAAKLAADAEAKPVKAKAKRKAKPADVAPADVGGVDAERAAVETPAMA
jgi:hypothetical protein